MYEYDGRLVAILVQVWEVVVGQDANAGDTVLLVSWRIVGDIDAFKGVLIRRVLSLAFDEHILAQNFFLCDLSQVFELAGKIFGLLVALGLKKYKKVQIISTVRRKILVNYFIHASRRFYSA